MAQRSLNEMRLSITKKQPHSSYEYQMIKKYWHLFDKPSNKLKAKQLYYRA
nr:hypothetical protein [Lentilactobacillus hilgardii]